MEEAAARAAETAAAEKRSKLRSKIVKRSKGEKV
jgi:hypothetical protein